MSTKTIRKIRILIISIVIIVFNHLEVFATSLDNTLDQYMELKVVSIEDIDNADKQIVLEWWSHNLNFKGLDLRFSYDDTKIKPSKLSDNSYVSDKTSFEFANDFASYMNYFVLGTDNGMYRCVMSLEKNDDSGMYIENDTDLGYVVNTNVDGGVLLGRMSFRLFSGQIDDKTFTLKTDKISPQTGIKISQTETTEYEDQSIFRFSVLNTNATLSDIEYSFFNYEENKNGLQKLPSGINYTALDMDQMQDNSTDDVSKYSINLNEQKENISLKLTKSDENATIKINNEEVDISQTKELVLNPLGGEDTKIEVLVTAQDGITTHTYEITVHRPYGTIKGTVEINPTASKSENIATIRVYDKKEVDGTIDWLSLQNGVADTLHSSLISLTSINQKSNADGTYEIYVSPGEYDVLLDKTGYMDHIYKDKKVNEGDVIYLGNRELYAGDVNKDGIIQLQDLSLILNVFGSNDTSDNYDLKYDFNEDNQIQLQDYTLTLNNFGKSREIE